MTNVVKHVPDWSQFIEVNLLHHNVVCGVALITHQAVLVYAHGTLKNLPPNNWKQFAPVFRLSGEKHNQVISERGFQLDQGSGVVTKFTVHHQTHCSVYCGSSGRESGLLICNLPYGILISMYRHPQTASSVVPIVENFCAKLRT